MNPVAFEIFGLSIRWYGILISLGMILGAFVAMRRAKKENISEERILDLVLVAIPAAIIGARLYYVIFNWEYYGGDLLRILNTREGGLAIHGGVIAGITAGYFFCKYHKLSFRKLADICAPSIILGQAIGRWGNYINQEAFGRPTNLPWGIMVDGIKVHPTFLYESIWNFAVLFLLLRYDARKKFEGELLVLYGVLYSVGRFFIEGLRTDSLMVGPFRTAQVISILIILGGSFIIYRERSKIQKI
ncbi:phosphatidylglycerol:prolipoprotein diacylglycerol transferase [Geosporobacter subterraneus DSM 17957]|uniref:Phosphatidylglycerol--prolipoprotein diacylglyceryl transferase n=1 Tax=Geosporobacter subterraneus DSM 17957 TaxID=1121919 RepID=A0A1M6GWU0_9FIRM|nr:prolipoprotein diacylglyceryl transferase [Geosporobacter subterraneus]SHJ14409.1 phosphatidylglycerol:prolipoprotein diacylglycerol transferase [Geosporobacter subterraneus DSM 17957]